MPLTLFAAEGCVRCRIARKFMVEKGLAFEEHDAVAAGKDLFGQFYRAHRNTIFRGKEGIEFPVLEDGPEIRQGVAVVIAWLHSGTSLDGFIGRGELSKGWVSGINLSTGDPAVVDDLVSVLGFLKRNGLKLQLDTDGRNAAVLGLLLGQAMADRVVMDVKGPQALYNKLLGALVEPAEIARSMALAAGFEDHRFETTVAPVTDTPEGTRYLTPDEIAETARWLKEATGSMKQPYFLRRFDPAACSDKRLTSAEALPPEALFRYRTAARRYQVLTEIAKD